MKEIFWKLVVVATGIYVFIPELTDIIPFIGWLDEATALLAMNYALKQLDFDFKEFVKRKLSLKKT